MALPRSQEDFEKNFEKTLKDPEYKQKMKKMFKSLKYGKIKELKEMEESKL